MNIVYRFIGIVFFVWIASGLGACTSASEDPGGLKAARLLGVSTVSPQHPMTGNPVGGFSGLTYDPVAQAWLVVSNRQPDPIAYTLRTSYDPRPESNGNAWVAGDFSAWLGREWPVPGGPQDAEAVAIRRTATRNHQRFWAFEREPAIVVENLRTGDSRTLELPQDITDHYQFDGAFKALALVPEQVGDRLWVALGAPLTIDEQSDAGMTRVLAYLIDAEQSPQTFFYPVPAPQTEIAAMATIPQSGWRDRHPVYALETSLDEAGRRTLKLIAISGSATQPGRSYPILNRREVADLSAALADRLAAAPQSAALGLAIGPEIADRRGGRLVLVVTTNNRRQPDAQHLVYAFRIDLD